MPSKSRFHGTIWAKLLAHDRAHRLILPGDRVLVAVSGGPDSVCLADYMAQVSTRRGVRVRLAHFHHGLRGRAADRDAAFVRSLAARLGVPVDVEALPVRSTVRAERRSLEDAGRVLRYRALLRLAKLHRCNKVATGHQLDDQAETLLLHLLRGTRPEGFAGIPVRRTLAPGVKLVRPLLSIDREEVLEYLRYRGLRWREDETNRSPRFRRNWVRHRLLPMLQREAPGIRERLALMASAWATALRGTAKPADAAPGRGRGRAPRRRVSRSR